MRKLVVIQWKKIVAIILLIVLISIGTILPIYLYGKDFIPLLTIFAIVPIALVLGLFPSTIVFDDERVKSLFKIPFQKSFNIEIKNICSIKLRKEFVPSSHGHAYVCELKIKLNNNEYVGISLNQFDQKDEIQILSFFMKKGFNLFLLEDKSIAKSDADVKTIFPHGHDVFSSIAEWILILTIFLTLLVFLLINGFGIFYLLFVSVAIIPILAFALNLETPFNFYIKLNNEYLFSNRICLRHPFRAQDGWTINLKKVDKISFEMFHCLFNGVEHKTSGLEYTMIRFHYKDGGSRYLIRTIFSKKQLFTLLDYCKKYEIDIEKPEMEPDKEKDWIFEYFQNDKSCN